MSDKYVAKKYVTTASVTRAIIKCPNCKTPMQISGLVLYCTDPACKLYDKPYREVKSLTTIERVDSFRAGASIR